MPSTLFCLLKSEEPLTMKRKQTDFEAQIICFSKDNITPRCFGVQLKQKFSSDSKQVRGKTGNGLFLEAFVV